MRSPVGLAVAVDCLRIALMSTLDPFESLVSSLKTLENVHATAHYSPSAWVELVVEDRLIGPEILRRIVDHDCGIVDLATVDDHAVVVVYEVNNLVLWTEPLSGRRTSTRFPYESVD